MTHFSVVRLQHLAFRMVLATLVVAGSPHPAFARDVDPLIETRNCSAYEYAPPFAPAPTGYVPRYKTVAQRFLDAEKGIGPVTPSEFATLDAVLDEAKSRLKPLPAGLGHDEYDAFATQSLKTIDCILVRHGFVYPGGNGLVQLLSDGLDPTSTTDTRWLAALAASSHNAGRTDFIKKRGNGPFYVVDCDIASYIYVAIGEVMGYPLAMVDLPIHNFIRWIRPDGSSLDFETMDGIVTDDTYYVRGWAIPQSFVGKPGVLTTMSPGQLEAYHDFAIGISLTWKHDFTASIAEYKRSIAVDATLADAQNNLAWLYTVVPVANLRDGKQALLYAQQAANTIASGDVLDTLACAYGAVGNFAEAVNQEQRAIEIGWTPQGSDLLADKALLQNRQQCHDPNFGTDVRPFRPKSVVPNTALTKSTNVLH